MKGYAEMRSPLGRLFVAWRGEALVALQFAERAERWEKLSGEYGGNAEAMPPALRKALEAYFAGAVDAVDELRCEAEGTEFEREVWRMLRTIPAGRTASYGELAARMGKPGAARAVGRANALNPIAIVVPCHRVIGSNAKLTGYAGGLERKQWLLDHERAHAQGVSGQLRIRGW